jgi:hypothetical protein
MSVYYYISRNSGPFVKEGRREITEAEVACCCLSNKIDRSSSVPQIAGRLSA